jgi:hypothetical protein
MNYSTPLVWLVTHCVADDRSHEGVALHPAAGYSLRVEKCCGYLAQSRGSVRITVMMLSTNGDSMCGETAVPCGGSVSYPQGPWMKLGTGWDDRG